MALNFLIPAAIQGGLGLIRGLGQHKAYDEGANRYNQAMGRARQLSQNPAMMYQNDPGLLELRRMRMNDVQSRQLARTGGTLGGNYGRQLMREGSAFDRAALQDAIGTQMQMAGQYAPYAQAQAQMGGPMGILGGIGQGVLGDYMFNQFLSGLGGIGGNVSATGIQTGGVPMVSQNTALPAIPMYK